MRKIKKTCIIFAVVILIISVIIVSIFSYYYFSQPKFLCKNLHSDNVISITACYGRYKYELTETEFSECIEIINNLAIDKKVKDPSRLYGAFWQQFDIKYVNDKVVTMFFLGNEVNINGTRYTCNEEVCGELEEFYTGIKNKYLS